MSETWAAALILVGYAVVGFLAVWLIPKWQLPKISNATERAKLEDDFRKTVAQIVGALEGVKGVANHFQWSVRR
jgi:hypothetical protein